MDIDEFYGEGFGAFGEATWWSSASLNAQGSILKVTTPSGVFDIEVPAAGGKSGTGDQTGNVEVYNPGANNEIFVDGRSISPGGTIAGAAGYVQEVQKDLQKGHQSSPAEVIAYWRKLFAEMAGRGVRIELDLKRRALEAGLSREEIEAADAATMPGMSVAGVEARSVEIAKETRGAYDEADVDYAEMLRLEKLGMPGFVSAAIVRAKYYAKKAEADLLARQSGFWTGAAYAMKQGQAQADMGRIGQARGSLLIAGGMLALAGQARQIPPETVAQVAAIQKAMSFRSFGRGSGYGGAFHGPAEWMPSLFEAMKEQAKQQQIAAEKLEKASWTTPDPRNAIDASGGGLFLTPPTLASSAAPGFGDAASDLRDAAKQKAIDEAMALADVDPETLDGIDSGVKAVKDGKGMVEGIALPDVDIANNPTGYAKEVALAISAAAVAVPLGIAAVVQVATVVTSIAVGSTFTTLGAAAFIGAAVPVVGAIIVGVVALVTVGYLIYKGISWLMEEPEPLPMTDYEYLQRYDKGEFREDNAFLQLPEDVKRGLRNEMRAREAKRRGLPLILEEANKLNVVLDPPREEKVNVRVPPTASNPQGVVQVKVKTGAAPVAYTSTLGTAAVGAGAGFLVGGPVGAAGGALVGWLWGKR